MKDIPVSLLTAAITTLLTEAYLGPPDPTATWFIDNAPPPGRCSRRASANTPAPRPSVVAVRERADLL